MPSDRCRLVKSLKFICEPLRSVSYEHDAGHTCWTRLTVNMGLNTRLPEEFEILTRSACDTREMPVWQAGQAACSSIDVSCCKGSVANCSASAPFLSCLAGS
jgi:hypothetical protein